MNPYNANSKLGTKPNSSTESLTGVFIWLAGGAVLVGGLPYLYPSAST